MKNHLVKYAAVAASVVLAVGLNGAAARAASGDYGLITTSANHRTCPDTRCGLATAAIPAGAWVQVWCWRDAGSAFGVYRWFRVRYAGVDGWVSAGAMNPQPSVPYCSDIRPNEALFAGQSVWSPNGLYHLTMQGDGNLVMYAGSSPLWATRTAGAAGAWMMMQGDGNFVVYNSASQPLWSTGTGGNAGAWLNVQNDGNLVLYYGTKALYASAWHETWGAVGTGNFGVWGNCTYYALQRFNQYSGVWPNWAVANHNAWQWKDDARAFGWNVQPYPSAHSIVVFPRGVDGASQIYGHVAWVEGVRYHADGTAWIDIKEMNYYNGLNGIDSRNDLPVTSDMAFIMAPSR